MSTATPIQIVSLGAGVQSSTMALMAAAGEITPMPTCAIFADTQAEPKAVYEWLEWLEKQLPVHRVTKGNLETASLRLRTSAKGNRYTKHAIPAFIDDGVKQGMMMRQCTADFKIEVIQREIRRVAGKSPVIQWIGISLDEAHRMKPARSRQITNRWPLIEKRMTRNDCLRWMADHGYPTPPRSACVFCPYHDNAEWARLKREEPESFERAAVYEDRLRETMREVTNFRGVPSLHRSGVRLREIDFERMEIDSRFFFGNECEGHCGV